MNEQLKIVSLNVHGLADLKKQREVFNILRKHKYDVICLQEVHSSAAEEELWHGPQWHGPVLFSHGETNARGVCVLLGEGVDNYEIKHRDIDGRMLILEIECKQMQLTICNLYGPNEDRPGFFQDVFGALESCNYRDMVVVGDFNFVMDVSLDRVGSHYNHNKSHEPLSKHMDNIDLTDIWCILHPEQRIYSWFRGKPHPQYAQLDFGIISDNLVTRVADSTYSAGYRMDHSMFHLTFNTDLPARGKGFWKMNTKHIYNEDFKEAIANIVDEAKNKYETCNPATLWELIKCEIISFSQGYAHQKVKDDKDTMNSLTRASDFLTKLLHEKYCPKVESELVNIRSKIELLQQQNVQTLLFTNRARYYAEGEHNTRYFFSMAKSRSKGKTMHSIIKESGHMTDDPKDILEEQARLY